MTANHNRLRLMRAGIDTYQQPVVYMHRDCAVCRAEGFTALTRVLIRSGEREQVLRMDARDAATAPAPLVPPASLSGGAPDMQASRRTRPV